VPQFTDPGSAWPLALQIGVLGARPSLARAVSHMSGAAM
jgi:hypothetical protein